MELKNINKNFIKDFKLPIAIYEEPYFSYLLSLLDPYYNTKEKYNIYINDFKNFGDSFFQDNKDLVASTITYLKSKKEYDIFNNIDMSNFQKDIKIKGKELYQSSNANKFFISVDLVKANFQSLFLVVPDFFDGHKKFEDFALSRGFNDTLLNSKISRQIIFGNINPQRQQKIQKFMMNNIVFNLIEGGLNPDYIYSLSSDEVFFEIDETINVSTVKGVLSNLNYDLRIEKFQLLKPFENNYFVKKYDEGYVDFKMVPTAIMAEFIKKYENKEVIDMDLYFYDENKRLSKFLQPYIK